MKKKLSKELSARTADDSSTKDEEMHVSPAIAKPIVVGCQSQARCHNDYEIVYGEIIRLKVRDGLLYRDKFGQLHLDREPDSFP